jgi:hypothetical protein
MGINLTDSPVWDDYRRQTARDPDALVNLTSLWRAAGSPRGRSPRQHYRGTRLIMRDEGRRGSCWADPNTALCYAQILDANLMWACGEAFFRQLDADPAGNMAGLPSPLMAMFAIPAMMAKEGIDADAARDRLVAEVARRVGGGDAYAGETLVARVRRAVEGEEQPK